MSSSSRRFSCRGSPAGTQMILSAPPFSSVMRNIPTARLRIGRPGDGGAWPRTAVQPAGQVVVDELLLGVLVEGVRPELAAEPALLVPAERVGGVDHVPVVDPDRAGLELAGHVERPLVVGAPDPGGQPVLGVV